MTPNPAVQGTWRMKPRQAPDLERYALSGATMRICRSIVTLLVYGFLAAGCNQGSTNKAATPESKDQHPETAAVSVAQLAEQVGKLRAE